MSSKSNPSRAGDPLLPDELALVIPPGAKRVTMNASLYTGVRKFGRDILDINSDASLWKSGFMGMAFGTEIHVSRSVAPEHIEIEGGGVYCRHSSKVFKSGSCGRLECACHEVLGM